MTRTKCAKCGGSLILIGAVNSEATKGVYMQYKCRNCGSIKNVLIKPEEEKKP